MNPATKARLHGLTSLGLVTAALLIALAAIFRLSWGWGLAYLLGSGLSLGVIIYAFCAKCPCRTHCGHVIPGKVAVALTNRHTGPYTGPEIALTGLSLLWLIGLPQPWLWQYKGLFIVFWLLNAVALLQIASFVCRACDNVYCPAKLRR